MKQKWRRRRDKVKRIERERLKKVKPSCWGGKKRRVAFRGDLHYPLFDGWRERRRRAGGGKHEREDQVFIKNLWTSRPRRKRRDVQPEEKKRIRMRCAGLNVGLECQLWTPKGALYVQKSQDATSWDEDGPVQVWLPQTQIKCLWKRLETLSLKYFKAFNLKWTQEMLGLCHQH